MLNSSISTACEIPLCERRCNGFLKAVEMEIKEIKNR